jgi:ferric-chelate reductase
VTAIFSAYNYISFKGDPENGMWETRCRNPFKVASIYASSEIYCHDEERRTGLTQLAKLCQEVGHSELRSRAAVAEHLTEESIRNMRIVDYLELSRVDYQNTPVLLSASYFNRMFDTIVCAKRKWYNTTMETPRRLTLRHLGLLAIRDMVTSRL